MAEPQAEKTTRDRLRDLLQGGMEKSSVRVATNFAPLINQLGISPESTAALLMGGDKSPLPLGLGVADFVPFLGTALGTEDAIQNLKEAKQSIKNDDYLGAGVDVAFGALGLIPGAAGTAKYGRKAIKGMRNIDVSKIPALMRPPTHAKLPTPPIEQGMAKGGSARSKLAELLADDDAHMAGGGKAKALVKSLLKPDTPAVNRIVVPSKLEILRRLALNQKGAYGAQRVERAADEIKNLTKLYSPKALDSAFLGDNAKALMTMNPKDFERYAIPLENTGNDIDYDNIKKLRNIRGGFSDVPFLEINKERQGLPTIPFIYGHEGRHRNRAMAASGEQAGLVRLEPRAELREPFPRRSQEEYIEALRQELGMTGNKVIPEADYERKKREEYMESLRQRSGMTGDKVIPQGNYEGIDLPPIYKQGGEVHMARGGSAKAKLKSAIGRGRAGIREPQTTTSITKEGGGNWLAGSVEGAMKPLKGSQMSPEDIALANKMIANGRLNPELAATQKRRIEESTRNAPLNQFIDKQLTRYVKNQMATKEDPIRALAEKGTLHVNPEQLNFNPESYGKYLQAGQQVVAQSPTAKSWEGVSDLNISPMTARQAKSGDSFYDGENIVDKNPWLNKVSDEASVYSPTDPQGFSGDLGFDHLIDELRNATNPASGLPRELLIKPESLSKLSVPQAVERVAKINEWRAAQKAEADVVRARNPATVMHKDYPDKGYSWQELRLPENMELPEGYRVVKYEYPNKPTFFSVTDPKGITQHEGQASEEAALKAYAKSKGHPALEDALKYEGEQMGHCVGGYCPDVASGSSRIYSLRDAKGQPHVTVEVKPPEMVGGMSVEDFLTGPQRIVQIKGKGNAAPNAEYLPFVQDFVKSGKWSDVGDFSNTGMAKVTDLKPDVQARLKENFGDRQYVTHDELDSVLPESFYEKLVPRSERGMAGAMIPPYGAADEGMKRGGEVHMKKGGKAKGAIKSGLRNMLSETTAPPPGVEPMVVRTKDERELKGAMRPSVEPVRGQTSKEMQAAQREQLTPQQREKLKALKSQYPDFAQATKFMMPGEVSKIIENPGGVKEMNALLQVIPNAKEMAAVAKTGEAKRGWYRASTQAIMNVFGDDAPRFSSLLAALSPQNSVETNLLNTLNTWKNWTAAGRPTDDRSIREVLGRSVQGTKGEESVLEAWAQNAIRSLSAQDPSKVVLSGAKVDSFWRNLADDVYRVTNDAWQANGMGIQKKLFGQKPTDLQLQRGDPGLTPGYIGASARTREAGQMANMFPSEAQETTWSTFMPLYEMQERLGLPAREILQRGLLTPEVIRGTPDFSTLFNDPTYRKILDESGYGEQLSNLKPHQWPEAKIDLNLSEQRDLENTARRLEGLRSDRNKETRSRTVSLPPEGRASRAYPFETAEYIPMRGAGHAEELIDAPFGQRQAFTLKMSGAFTDFAGKDIFHGALDLKPLRATGALGSYQPPGKYPWIQNPKEVQPMFALGHESPVTASLDLPKRTHDKMRSAAALRGAMTGQGGQAYNVQIPDPNGTSLFVPLDKKVGKDEMTFSAGLVPENTFLADTGRGMSVINYGDKYGGEEAELIAQRLGGTDSVPTTSRGDYIDYSKDWQQPQGSGAVATKMLSHMGPLSVRDFNELSKAAQVPAGEVYDAYRALESNKGYVVREDLMNMLRILRNQGIPGVAAALAAGEALPSEPEQAKRTGGLASLKYGGGRA